MLEKYYHINEAAGLSITIEKEGSYVVNTCSLSIEDNRLHFQKKLPGGTTINELAKLLPAKTFFSLNLSGKGVLQKQIAKETEINPNNFSKILPNAKMEDFYVQHFVSGDTSFVAVIRRATADEWISRLKEAGFIPLMLSLGPFPVQHVLPQLNVYENEIIFDGHVIRRNEQQEWTAYNYMETAAAPFPLKIESESISEKLLLAYAAAFQLLLSSKVESIQADVPSLTIEYKRVLEERKLKVHGFLVLSLFFILLLANFFLFSWLNSSNARLTDQVSRTAQSTSDVQQINDRVLQKEALLKLLGWEGNSDKSALIDQVAALLPAKITWTEAAVDPVDLQQSRNQKNIVFSSRLIRITGNCERIIPVNEWIARIKTKAWVKNVQLDSYTFSQEENTGRFTLLIDY